jgi:hypothetical protein
MLNESLLQEIEDSILSQGELSKQDILDTWKFEDADYQEVRKALRNRGAVTSGPKRTGGLSAKRNGTMPRRLLTEKWEVEVVTCLMYLFQHADLEKLLGSLVYTVRTSRTAMTGEDRRGTKRELATMLTNKLQSADSIRGAARARTTVRGIGCGDSPTLMLR